MIILHLCNECAGEGNGIVNVALDLACKQAQAGHSVHFASSGGSFAKLLDQHQVQHHYIGQLWRQPFQLILGLFRLRSLVRNLRPDIVHVHMMTGAAMAWCGRALVGFGEFRLVSTVHNEWRRTANLMGLADVVIVASNSGRALALKRGIPESKIRVVPNGPLGTPRRAFTARTKAQTLSRSGVNGSANQTLIITIAGFTGERAFKT